MAAVVDRYHDRLEDDAAVDRRIGYDWRHPLTELGDIELQVPRIRHDRPTEVSRAYARRTPEIDRVNLAAALCSGCPPTRWGDAAGPVRPQRERCDSQPGCQDVSMRVVAKAKWTKGEGSPCFVVTSLKRAEIGARHLHEDIYCACGDMESRIKECQLDRYADRTSAATNARQLTGAVVCFGVLCAHLCGVPHRLGRIHLRRRHLRRDPPQAVENRCAGAHLGVRHQDRHSLGLPDC